MMVGQQSLRYHNNDHGSNNDRGDLVWRNRALKGTVF